MLDVVALGELLNDFITILLLVLIENLLVDGVVYDTTRHS